MAKVKITLSKGPQGVNGPQGPQGVIGDSAYKIWLAEGNSGTVQDYLDSLVGAQGIQGNTGAAASPPPAPDAPTVVVGSTTTGAAGTSATVTDTDSGANVSLDFVVPQGATGATGAGLGATGAGGGVMISAIVPTLTRASSGEPTKLEAAIAVSWMKFLDLVTTTPSTSRS